MWKWSVDCTPKNWRGQFPDSGSVHFVHSLEALGSREAPRLAFSVDPLSEVGFPGVRPAVAATSAGFFVKYKVQTTIVRYCQVGGRRNCKIYIEYSIASILASIIFSTYVLTYTEKDLRVVF